MTSYVGGRPGGKAVVLVAAGHVARPLDPRNDLRNHSPDGFEWGYGGSGPTQLALAILADALGDDARALKLYQQFKWAVINDLGDAWEISADQVRDWAERWDKGEEARLA